MGLRLVVLAGLVAACVPATEEVDPRGGVVARLVPSAETNGKAFQSHDGWTVTIDKFAIRATLNAERPLDENDAFGGYIGGSGLPSIVAASEACELTAVAFSVGPAVAYINLAPRFSAFEKFKDERVCAAVDRTLLPYFERTADSAYPRFGSDIPESFQNTPSLVLLAHAEKEGRTIRIELAIDARSFQRQDGTSEKASTTIVANQGALVRIPVDASALFRETDPNETKNLSFDRVAKADANGDGLVTGAEMGPTEGSCPDEFDPADEEDEEDEYTECVSLLAIIDRNVPYVFGANSPK